jgi:hypothetical protein
VGIFNPPNHPTGIDLGANLFQAGSDLGNIFVSFDQMTSRATDLLEEYLTLG